MAAPQTVQAMTSFGRQTVYGDDALLTDGQASDLLFLSVRTLQTWRCQKTGPAYIRAGRAIRYQRADVLAWIEANRVPPQVTVRSEVVSRDETSGGANA
jgi:predicted DNA-binding transcriptional regulator AlpA